MENPLFDRRLQLPDNEEAMWMGCQAGGASQGALRDLLRFGSLFYGARPPWLSREHCLDLYACHLRPMSGYTKESDMFDSRSESSTLSARVRTVRIQNFGEHGGPMLAELVGVTQRRLARIEAGGPIPAEFILKLIDLTGVNPRWLLSGEGEVYGSPAPSRIRDRDWGSHLG
jgi:hypothetical protein